jgi:hypothetical protein
MHIQENIRAWGRVLAASAAVLWLAACHPRMSMQEEQSVLRGLTDTHFRDTTVVKDDSLDVVASFSTENGLDTGGGIPDFFHQDEFLRGFIDKKTGRRQFQLYFTVSYSGPERFFNAATYETPSGPQQAVVIVISRNRSCQRVQGTSWCDHAEDLGFALDENLVRSIASRYGDGDPLKQAWHYKFTAHSGYEIAGIILPAEAKGLLERMGAHRLVK